MDVTGFGIFLFVLLVLGLFLLVSTVRTMPQGYAYTVERFGRYTRTLTPGLNITTPFIERIGRRLNMMEQPRAPRSRPALNG